MSVPLLALNIIFISFNSLEDISAASLRNSRKWFLTLPSELGQLFVPRPLRSPADGINLDFRKKIVGCVDYLGPGLPSGLRLRRHGALQLDRQSAVFAKMILILFCEKNVGTLRHHRAHRELGGTAST